jgi:hypothetical protein
MAIVRESDGGSRGGADGPAQLVSLVLLLPAESGQFAAEMAVPGGLTVDGPAQVQGVDDALGRQLEVLGDQFGNGLVGQSG